MADDPKGEAAKLHRDPTDGLAGDVSRRSFLRAASGVAVATAAVAATRQQLVQLGGPPHAPKLRDAPYGDYPAHVASVTLNVNGSAHTLQVPHHRTLLLALREDLGLTGAKKSCNLGQCGACTVLLDGAPVYSCFVLAADAQGRQVRTIEGLSEGGKLHPVQQAFCDHMGSQCGHCTPGMIMSGVALLEQNPRPTEDEVRAALAGNLCRCGNYPNEIAAVLAAGGAPVKAAASATAPGLPSHVQTLDARAKATGEAKYAGDYGFGSADLPARPLFAKVVRSPYGLADIADIDDSEARTVAGFRGMVTFRDVPGYRAHIEDPHSPVTTDRWCMNGRARYVGDAIAAIAADDLYAATEAVQRVRVDYRVRKAQPDAEYNLRNNVRAIHQGGAVAGFGGPQPADKPTIEYKRGDIAAGFKQADLIVEQRYVTPIQCHVPIEPHAVIAHWAGDRVTFWDSQQSVFAAQETIANALALKADQVRVIAHYVGGGFGGKCTDTPGKTLYQAIAALLSRKTGRPVRLEYTLKELMFAEDTRNPFIFYFKTGVKKDGSITALECKAIQPTGGYASSGPPVVSVAGEGVVDTYRIPNYWFHGYSVYTTSPVGGEFRGFGHPQAVFAREVHMDEVAEAIGMDPVQFRRRNTLHAGDVIDTDVVPNVPLLAIGAEECLQKGAEAIDWKRWQPPSKKSGRIRRGLGMRFSQEHTGRNASNGLVWMGRDGKVHVPIGSGNLGTESHTGIAVIVANVLGVPVEQLDVSWGDTDTSAWDFVSDASRAIHCHGKAMYNAALDLKRQLDAQKRGQLTPRTDFTPLCDARNDMSPYLDETTGKVMKPAAPKLSPATEAMARAIVGEGGIVGLGFYVWNPGVEAWGASFAEVEVDMETGQVRVLKLVAAHDCGRVIHCPGAVAQVQGGGIMGLGYATTEELAIDPHTGIPVNQSLYEYRPPTVLDVPELVPILVEAPVDPGPFGAKGLGENPMFDAAAAVGNAIYNATGVRMREIPFTVGRVYAELKRAGKLES
ncbi:MAG TPA: molybdopterin cofactor-binding domain-containing protein [Terriglobales bacterium]|nr:molybdopterin cofactor-binding domain-containing protein [Terriglobales bacterium]